MASDRGSNLYSHRQTSSIYQRLLKEKKVSRVSSGSKQITLDDFQQNFIAKPKKKKGKKKKKIRNINSKSASSSNFDSVEREADFDEDCDEMSYKMKCDTHRTKTTQLQCGIEYYVQSNKFTNNPVTRHISDDEELKDQDQYYVFSEGEDKESLHQKPLSLNLANLGRHNS